MRIGSLFSGAGGLDMAVEQVFGGRTVWHCELDPAASKVLAHRWPDVPNLGDISAVDWSQVEPVDVLCGGFPCQDVSAAGRRAGIKDGTRSGLWAVYANAIAALQPPLVVVENVRGLLNAEAHRDVEPADTVVGDRPSRPVLRAAGAVLGDLADLGYDAGWATVSAASVGAPHRRERVFVVATNASRDRLYGYRPQSGISGRGLEGQPYGDCRDAALSGDAPIELLPTPAASDCTGGGQHPDKRQGHSRQLIDYVLLLPTPKASDGEFCTPRTSGRPIEKSTHLQTIASLTDQWGKYAPAIARWENVTRPAPAPTEPNKNGNPRLAAAFSEWMMGWPAGWVTDVPGISRNDALRIVGNGVVPQQATSALRYLLAVSERAA